MRWGARALKGERARQAKRDGTPPCKTNHSDVTDKPWCISYPLYSKNTNSNNNFIFYSLFNADRDTNINQPVKIPILINQY